MGFPTAAAKPEPSRTGPRPTRSGGRGVPSATYELQDRVEEPGWLRAQSGRFRAMASRLGCSSYGWRMTSSSRSEEHTSELQSLMRISYAVFCLKKKTLYVEASHNYEHA